MLAELWLPQIPLYLRAALLPAEVVVLLVAAGLGCLEGSKPAERGRS